MQVVPNGTVGAQVRNVDLARAAAPDIAAIKQAWYRHSRRPTIRGLRPARRTRS
jgi:hypothetical protein